MKFSKQEQTLMKKDNSLKKLIISNKHIKVTKPTENYYDSLINLVISQFISRSAASLEENMSSSPSENNLNIFKVQGPKP